MRYVLGVGLTFKKYKKNATIQIFSNNTLIDEYELDKDIYSKEEEEKYVNYESAISQLERYKLLMDSYVEQNCSITVSYKEECIFALQSFIILGKQSGVQDMTVF